MKIMHGTLVGLVVGLLSTSGVALAASPAVRPAEIFGELVAASPAAEQPRWSAALSALGSPGPLPPVEIIMTNLGKSIGANGLEGLDGKRPVAMLMVDPQRFPKPVLLVAEVSDEKRFATSLALSPEIVAKRQKRLVVLGAADLVALAGDYALTRLSGAPQSGLRGRVFVQTVWKNYGAMAQAMKGMLTSQGSTTPTSGVSPATMAKIFDGAVSGIEQSNELGIEVTANSGALELILSLAVRAGSGIDAFAAAQKPSDFALLLRLADQPYSMLAGGRLDLGLIAEGIADAFFSQGAQDPKKRAQFIEWMKLSVGDIATVGNMSSPAHTDSQYLLRGAGAAKLVAAFPLMIEAMTKSGMLEGMVKMTRTEKPPFSYDGLSVAQSEMHYDFSKMPSPALKGESKFSVASAWTGWDDTLAMASGATAPEQMKKLLDAARHDKGNWKPSPAIRAAIDRARAAKESFWMNMDLSALTASTGKPSPLPAGVVPSVGVGFGNHTAWLRITVGGLAAARPAK